MIYDQVNPQSPIRQGDIFRRIPRVDLSLASLAVVDEDESYRKTSWRDALADNDNGSAIAALLPIKPVDAIVITQNCDAARGEYLCLCQIDTFLLAIGQKDPPKNSEKWQSLIVKKGREMPRLFYLPADSSLGFSEPMAADFRVILRIPRNDLDDLRDHRAGRLNETAFEHFRESLAHFFRRYAYNEWYPLTKEQFEAYAKACGEPVTPFRWQE